MKKIDYKTIIPILAIVIIQLIFAIVVTNKIIELENKLDKFKLYNHMFNESVDQRWEYENDNGLIKKGEVY